jgi:hypothetical protein
MRTGRQATRLAQSKMPRDQLPGATGADWACWARCFASYSRSACSTRAWVAAASASIVDKAFFTLGRDEIAEADAGIALFGIGLVDQLLEAAGGTARPGGRTAHRAGTANGLIGDHAVVPGIVLRRRGGPERLGNAITLGFILARADRDLVALRWRTGIIAIDDELVDLLARILGQDRGRGGKRRGCEQGRGDHGTLHG